MHTFPASAVMQYVGVSVCVCITLLLKSRSWRDKGAPGVVMGGGGRGEEKRREEQRKDPPHTKKLSLIKYLGRAHASEY